MMWLENTLFTQLDSPHHLLILIAAKFLNSGMIKAKILHMLGRFKTKC